MRRCCLGQTEGTDRRAHEEPTTETFALAAAALLAMSQPALAEQADPGKAPKQAGNSPVKVFILAGQSNMDGNAKISTIDFLGEDKEHGALLKHFKPDGKTLVTRDDVWVAHLCLPYGRRF